MGDFTKVHDSDKGSDPNLFFSNRSGGCATLHKVSVRNVTARQTAPKELCPALGHPNRVVCMLTVREELHSVPQSLEVRVSQGLYGGNPASGFILQKPQKKVCVCQYVLCVW